jgi:hypothetical protein
MADDTSKAESAQALFCAMADFIGASKVDKVFDEKKYPNYKSFKEYWNETYPTTKIGDSFRKHVDSGTTNLSIIEKFLENNDDWYISSVKIAKKLIKDIDDISTKFTSIKRPSWSSVFYVRGDKSVMDNIALLFKECNDGQKLINKMLTESGERRKLIFGDINKWSPADIYFASPKAKKEILDLLKNKKGLTFVALNLFVAKMIANGDLLPLSLKKQTHEVTIHKVNFHRPTELKEIEKVKSYGLSNWKPRKPGEKHARDLKIYYSDDKTKYVQMQHTTDSSGGWKATNMDKDSEARHGSLASQHIFADALAIIDKPFATRWLSQFTSANNIFKKELKTFVDKEFKGKKPTAPPKGVKLKSKDRIKFEEKRVELSVNVTNKLMPELIKWFNKSNNADKFVRVIYEYSASRSEDSGPFVISK